MIVVFGSLNMDLVMTVPTLPKPGETVLCPGYQLKPGGKGNNQAIAAARAGAPVAMAGCVGPDAFGSGLIENLVRNGVDTTGVHVAEEATGCAMICVDKAGENFISVASGANLTASAARVPDEALGSGTTVLMQMEVPAEENWALIRRAHGLGARTVLNVAPAADVPTEILKLVDILIVNEHEAAEIAARLELTSISEMGLARDLARTCGVTCVVTLGGAGALMAEPGGALWTAAALKISPVDTTGAGDAFCGILTAALDAGMSPEDALHRASVGAAIACLGLGAQESLPTAEAIDARLADVSAPLRLS
ncbi:ribokinase [Skermanella stibiiresistens SB22]|uniref:Ribokinase n=1 Tax=Skermanella stibiiresistens SB22 TaxID=1385369 RepID=W9H1K2_9PROT|nr:ribokinase [Skermanella stibiiresistens]EWY40065.1 ribokinase [Skermanella stibiiresistens SB22]